MEGNGTLRLPRGEREWQDSFTSFTSGSRISGGLDGRLRDFTDDKCAGRSRRIGQSVEYCRGIQGVHGRRRTAHPRTPAANLGAWRGFADSGRKRIVEMAGSFLPPSDAGQIHDAHTNAEWLRAEQ